MDLLCKSVNTVLVFRTCRAKYSLHSRFTIVKKSCHFRLTDYLISDVEMCG